MPKGKIEVKAEWDAEANVWVATSDDVPGLVTEADTVETLYRKVLVMVPELLEANGVLAAHEIQDIPIELIAHRQQLISLRG